MKMKQSRKVVTTSAALALSDEQRNHHVRVAAYYIAQDRDFQGGDPVEDWNRAEQETRLLVDSGRFRG